jgi:ankyrin repeat protein
LFRGAQLSTSDGGGYTAACHAAAGGNLEILKLCREAGADFTGTIAAAVAHHHNAIADWLVEVDSTGWRSVPAAAAKSNNLRMVLHLLRQFQPPEGLNDRDPWHCPPLVHAATNNHEDMVRLLLSAEADINVSRRDGLTAISASATAGYLEIAEILVAHEEIDLRVRFAGRTPLHSAVARTTNLQLMGMLAQRDPDMILENDNEGVCPLQAALICHSGSDVYNILLGCLRPDADLTPLNTAAFADLCRILRRENLIAKTILERARALAGAE